MTPPFRLGIIGAGRITETGHLPAALASKMVVVCALVDSSESRLNSVVKKYGISPVLSKRTEDILGEVDGVVIATPNHTHREIALTCIDAGVPCLVEKPIATTTEDAAAVADAAERAGVVVGVGYSTRFREEVDLLQALIRKEYFGSVRRFLYQSGSAGGWSPVSSYNLDRTASGGGVLVVTGAHFLDRMLYWFGYPDEVELADDSQGGPESHCVATVRYSSSGRSFSGIIRLSKVVPLVPGFAMETELGVVLLTTREPGELVFRPRDSPDIELVLRGRNESVYSFEKGDMQNELEDFVKACQQGTAPKVSAREGVESVRLIEQFYRHRRSLPEPWKSVDREWSIV